MNKELLTQENTLDPDLIIAARTVVEGREGLADRVEEELAASNDPSLIIAGAGLSKPLTAAIERARRTRKATGSRMFIVPAAELVEGESEEHAA